MTTHRKMSPADYEKLMAVFGWTPERRAAWAAERAAFQAAPSSPEDEEALAEEREIIAQVKADQAREMAAYAEMRRKQETADIVTIYDRSGRPVHRFRDRPPVDHLAEMRAETAAERRAGA